MYIPCSPKGEYNCLAGIFLRRAKSVQFLVFQGQCSLKKSCVAENAQDYFWEHGVYMYLNREVGLARYCCLLPQVLHLPWSMVEILQGKPYSAVLSLSLQPRLNKNTPYAKIGVVNQRRHPMDDLCAFLTEVQEINTKAKRKLTYWDVHKVIDHRYCMTVWVGDDYVSFTNKDSDWKTKLAAFLS